MGRTGKLIALVLALGLVLTGCWNDNNGGDGTEERPSEGGSKPDESAAP